MYFEWPETVEARQKNRIATLNPTKDSNKGPLAASAEMLHNK
jgi:hypothetical protein